MDTKDKDSEAEGTTLDPKLARPRLKDSLVEPDTGLFLRMEKGKEPGRTYTLSSGGTYLIGREGADVVVDDTKVSRKHAELALLGPGAYFLRDLASTNGTFLNGKRVAEKVKLNAGDSIRVGDTVLAFSEVTGSVPLSG